MIDTLLAKLDGVQGRGPTWRAICPAHTSAHRTRSLAIRDAGDGRILLHCHAGCDVCAVVEAIGLDLADLMPPRRSDEGRPRSLRKPWSARQVVETLRVELGIAAVLLGDVARGKAIGMQDRQRASVVRERVLHAMDELTRAT
jgi:hypothetical protein